MRNSILRILLCALISTASGFSHAAFHLWAIVELYSDASGTLQFIEFSTAFSGQEFVAGHAITVTNVAGTQTNTFTLPNNLPTGTANRRFLIGTAGIQAAGGPPPDYIMPNGFLFTDGGTISFFGTNSGPYTALPTNGTLSRTFGGGDAANSPTNFAGMTGAVTPPPTVPGAPTGATATAGNGQASISFLAPANNGGATITSYSVTCTPGPFSQSGPGSPLVVTGLANGTPYDCTVRATNSAGQGAASASVNVTPVGPPGVPLNFMVSPRDSSVMVTFNPPASDGGSMIDNYTVFCTSPGGDKLSGGLSSPMFVGAMTNGVSYACSMRARNAAGLFGPFTAEIIVTPATIPGAPTLSTLVGGDGRVQVSFLPPASNGGKPILSFDVRCNNGSGDVVVNVAQSPALVTGLTNLTTYACRVSATNAMGTGPDSMSSNIVPDANVAPILLSAVYRKLHGVAGEQDIPIRLDTDVEGDPTVESRNVGTGHRVVMNFNVPIASIGVLTLNDPMNVELCCASASYNGFDTTLTLTGLPAVQRLTVLVDALNGAGSGTSFPLAFMPGDVTSSRRVNAADISAIKSRNGPVNASNARFDINLDGTVGSSDTSIVKSKSGSVMP